MEMIRDAKTRETNLLLVLNVRRHHALFGLVRAAMQVRLAVCGSMLR